jgi:hypothetical protein
MFVFLSPYCLSVCLPKVSLSVSLSIYPYDYQSVYLSVFLSVCPSVQLSVLQYVRPRVIFVDTQKTALRFKQKQEPFRFDAPRWKKCNLYMSVFMSVCPAVQLSVHPPVRPKIIYV